jgi:CheY-like chemotaxis protein
MRSDRASARLIANIGRSKGSAGASAESPPTDVVLVVDDEGLVREVVRTALEEGGYVVEAVEDGRAAIALLEEGGRALRALVTDVNLGRGPSGWDVAKRAREIYPDLAVVYLSGASLHEHATEGVANSAVLDKPFGVAQILARVVDLIGDAPRDSHAIAPPLAAPRKADIQGG